MNNKNLVYIQSIPRKSAIGLHNFTNPTSGKPLNKNKVGRAKDFIQALYSSKVGGLANYISYTPYIDPATGLQVIKPNGQPMMLQEHLENKWNKPEGYFTNIAANPKVTPKESEMTYFQRMVWSFDDGTSVLDLSKMDDEMFYYVCLASKKVANSEKEWREHKWPGALYFISHENESQGIKYTRAQIKGKAFAELHTKQMTDVTLRKLASLLELVPARAELSKEESYNLVYNYIDSNTPESKEMAKYNHFIQLLKTPPGVLQFEAQYLIKEAMSYRIMYERQGTYTWLAPSGNVIIGDSLQEAIDYIISPKRAKEVEVIQTQIKEKQ